MERVDKIVHFHRSHEIAIEENVFNVQEYLELFGPTCKLFYGFPGATVADIVGHRIIVIPPGYMDRARHHQDVFHAKVVGGKGDFFSQFNAFGPFGRVVAGQRIRPEKKGTKPADLDADLVS